MSRDNDNNCGISDKKLGLVALAASAGLSVAAWALSKKINDQNSLDQNLPYVAGAAFCAATAVGFGVVSLMGLFCKNRVQEDHLRVSADMVYRNPDPNTQDPQNAGRNSLDQCLYV